MTTGRNSKSGKGAYHKSHSAHGPQTHTELFWSCCNCELSALPNPSWHDQCPKCAKVRCDSCLVEWIKVRTDLSDKYSGTGARDSTFPSSGILSPSYKLSTESGTGIDTLSVVNTEGKLFKLSLTSTSTSLCIDQPLVDKGNPLSTSTGTIGSGFAQNLISASTLSPASSKSLDVFTDNNNTPNTITDNSERSYSSDDDTEVDSDELWKSRFIRTLDHCVLAACSHDLKLAALLIRKIHTIVGNWSRNGIWSHTPGASGGEGSGASGSMIGSGFSSGGPFNHHSEKRPLDGENVSDRPTKQSKISSGTEELEMNTSPKSPTFACHFYKKDPRKFNFRTNSKYKNCPHPSIPPNALRRITDHFKNHLLSQCDRCYAIFRDARALVEHRQPCEKQSSTLKEGIDDGQWDRIKEIVKKSTRKGRQEFEKWYDIWEVLFPGITPPATPWIEPEPVITSPLQLDPESMMSEIVSRVEAGVEQGTLPRNDQLYRDIFSIIRSALRLQSTTPTVSTPTATNYVGQQTDRESQIYSVLTIDNHNNDANGSSEITDILQVSLPESANNNDRIYFSSTNDFDPLPDIAIPELFTEQDWIESLDVLYQETEPHPLIANLGASASNTPLLGLSNGPREPESDHGNANSQIVDGFDFETFLSEYMPPTDVLEDPDTAFNPDVPERQQQQIRVDSIAGFGFFEPELESRTTEPSKSHKDRNRGLQGRFEYDVDDETIHSS